MGTGQARDPQPFTLEQRLLDAVRRGDRPTIERALELGATVQAKDDLARSTVVLATKDAGDLELVRWLRAKGAAIVVGGAVRAGGASSRPQPSAITRIAPAIACPDVSRRSRR